MKPRRRRDVQQAGAFYEVASRLPLAVCTIYEARFAGPVVRRVAATALTTLNDAITREAFARGVDCIDLRIVCDEDSDFANPIEPSTKGGAKIAGPFSASQLQVVHDARLA